MKEIKQYIAAARDAQDRHDSRPGTQMSLESMICGRCGMPSPGVLASLDELLRELHSRRKDGRQHGEPLVYTQEDIDEAGGFADDGSDGIMLSMERNMFERGLCTGCGRPNLRGLGKDDFLSREDASALAEMYVEEAAERRAGA